VSPARPVRGPLGLSVGSGTVGAVGAGLGATVVSALVAGGQGALSALAGVVVVVLFFVASLWLVEVANRVNPSLTLPVGLTVYSVSLLWLGLLAYGTSLPDRLSQGAFAWTVIAATLGWLLAQAVAVWRLRVPYVAVDLPTRDTSDEDRRPVAPATVRDGGQP
jgi:ATP synthase protein I